MRRAAERARSLSWWLLGFAALGAAFVLDEAAHLEQGRDFSTNTGIGAAAAFLGFVLLMVASAVLGAQADLLDALDGGRSRGGRSAASALLDKAALAALGEIDEPLPLRDVAGRLGLAGDGEALPRGEQMRLAEELKRRGWVKRRSRQGGRTTQRWHPPGP